MDPKKNSGVPSNDDPLSMVRRSMLYACGLTYEEIQRPRTPRSTPITRCIPGTSTRKPWPNG